MSATRDVVCVVQARTGSSRFPGKVLAELAGRPVLRFMLDRLEGLGPEVVVATSDLARDDPVEEVARAAGRPVVRGPERDVLARFAVTLDAFPAAHVVRLTADCPLVDPGIVGEVIALHLDRGADYTSNVLPRTFPKGLDVEVVRAEALRTADRCAADPVEREHVTPFVYRRPERFTLANLRADVLAGDERWTVDTREDLDAVRDLVARVGRDRFSWREAWAAVGPRAEPPRGAVRLVPAAPADAEFFLACRADPEAVRWSRSGAPIPPAEHARWFAAACDDPAIRLRVGVLDGERVGTVRVDVTGGVGEVGIAVAPARRGRGLGTALLRALLADVAADPQVVRLTALVHPDNHASLRAFARTGFVPDGEHDGFRVLRRDPAVPMEEA